MTPGAGARFPFAAGVCPLNATMPGCRAPIGSKGTAVVNSIDHSMEDRAPNRCLPFDGIGARHPSIVALSGHTPATNGNLVPAPGVVEFRCLKVVNQMSYLTVGSLENTSRLVDVSLNWTINSTG